MAIIVEHRPDQLLQENVRDGCPPGLENTFVGQVTVPTHKALLEFLDERVVGHEFADEGELQLVLDTWPEFVQGKVPRWSRDFDALRITGNGTIAFRKESPGGPFEVGVISTVS